jgi:hypothetical protein
MNWNDWRIIQESTWRDWGGSRKASVRTGGVPAKIRITALPSTSLEQYLYASLLSVSTEVRIFQTYTCNRNWEKKKILSCDCGYMSERFLSVHYATGCTPQRLESVLKFSGCGKVWLFTDNDGHAPTVWTRPVTQQPMRVKIGTMTVTYVATDASRHKTKCNFTIKIEGKKFSPT